MIIDLEELMRRQEKRFFKLCDLSNPKATKVAFGIANRWNRIRKVIEYQRGEG
ncbi:MAG: hypothetical protein N4A64_03365 [Marinisporobacter sp.]|jgi:hypothetical protein|nr:hypothetical protein [Marinisporobacter sp.]